jgi:hypothetical protein
MKLQTRGVPREPEHQVDYVSVRFHAKFGLIREKEQNRSQIPGEVLVTRSPAKLPIVAFRSAKGSKQMKISFRGAKGDNEPRGHQRWVLQP